jgi:hypothetical protein
MENQEVYQIAEGVKNVTITHKKGLDEKAPVQIQYTGNIDTVRNFLKGKSTSFDFAQCTLYIERDNLRMTLIINEIDPYNNGTVMAMLQKSEQLNKWAVNEGREWTNQELADHCKMNRSQFSVPGNAMKLFSELKDIKIRVDKQYEAENDNRGTTRILVAQKVIENSITEKFKINIPIFKGEPKREFEIELYINPSNYNITLVSPEINDYIDEVRDEIFDREIALIKDEYSFSIIEK